MPMKRYKPEQIVTMLRQIEVSIANGKNTPQACKEAEITIQTFYRWRKEYGGLKMDQAKRLKELEKENGKLKRLVAEPSLPARSISAIGMFRQQRDNSGLPTTRSLFAASPATCFKGYNYAHIWLWLPVRNWGPTRS